MRHHTKFYADQPNRSRDVAVFLFLKMAAVCLLGFLKN